MDQGLSNSRLPRRDIVWLCINGVGLKEVSVLGGQYFLTSLVGGLCKKGLGLLCELQYIPVDFHWDNPFII